MPQVLVGGVLAGSHRVGGGSAPREVGTALKASVISQRGIHHYATSPQAAGNEGGMPTQPAFPAEKM